MKNIVLFACWSAGCILFGLGVGFQWSQKSELKKTVTTYQKIENASARQEKEAEKIKIIYRDLKSDDKDCEFVLNFDVSKCLPE